MRRTGHNHLRLVLEGQRLDLVIINLAGRFIQAVLHSIVDLAGEINLGTVGKMTAMGQAHSQYGIAGL